LELQEALGAEMAQKVKEKVAGWHILLAMKRSGAKDAEPGLFTLEKAKGRTDPLLHEIGRISQQAFNSQTREDLYASLNVVLGLLSNYWTSDRKSAWRIFSRIERLERKKLSELGDGTYRSCDWKDMEERTKAFCARLKAQSAANQKTGMLTPRV
jgi:hypothetical protein